MVHWTPLVPIPSALTAKAPQPAYPAKPNPATAPAPKSASSPTVAATADFDSSPPLTQKLPQPPFAAAPASAVSKPLGRTASIN